MRRLDESLAAAESAHGAAVACRDALVEALEPEAGAAVTALADLSPVALAEVLRVEGGWEAAVAAALGGPGGRVVLPGHGSAAGAIEAAGRLGAQGAGGARLLMRGIPPGTTPAGNRTMPCRRASWTPWPWSAWTPSPPAAVRPGPKTHRQGPRLAPNRSPDRCTAPRTARGLAGTLRTLLAGTALVEDLEAAVAWLDSGRLPERLHGAPLRLATRDGHVVGPGWTDVRGSGAGSRLERQAAADGRPGRVATEAGHEVERLRLRRGELDREVQQAAAAERSALDALNASDARFTAVTEQLARLNEQLAGANDGARRQRAELAGLQDRLAEATAAVAAAEERARATVWRADPVPAPVPTPMRTRPVPVPPSRGITGPSPIRSPATPPSSAPGRLVTVRPRPGSPCAPPRRSTPRRPHARSRPAGRRRPPPWPTRSANGPSGPGPPG